MGPSGCPGLGVLSLPRPDSAVLETAELIIETMSKQPEGWRLDELRYADGSRICGGNRSRRKDPDSVRRIPRCGERMERLEQL